MSTRQLAVRFAIASAIIFVALVVMQITTGASQQFFEMVQPPDVYAQKLVAHAWWLRVVLAVDDAFIGCYVATLILTALALPRRALSYVVLAGGVMVGLLDLEENHQMFALLSAAEHGLPVVIGDIVRRMEFSSMKFAVAHLSFFFLGFLLAGRSAAARALRVLCVAQLPLGMAGVFWERALPLQLGRAACLTAAYVLMAIVIANLPEAAAAASGSGARASRPGTMPGAAA
jgi:hypothetical protein